MTTAEGNSGGDGAAPDDVNSAVEDRPNNDGDGGDETPPASHRPADVALKQQRMKSWQPVLDPKWVITCYLLIGLCFIPTGIVIRKKSEDLIELKTVYESHLEDGTTADVPGCDIGNSPNHMWIEGGQTAAGATRCNFTMQVPPDGGDMRPPVLVHYEIRNFYQNYRKYVNSYDQHQLLGRLSSDQDSLSADECQPLTKIGGVHINPCGLMANTLFNDVIRLESIVAPDGEVVLDAPMVETGIAWSSDLEWKFSQPNGFSAKMCDTCDQVDCDCDELEDDGSSRKWSCKEPYTNEDGKCFVYHYPEDDTTQYLYETYPMVVNPLEGVRNEHFVVWMRAAALPHFRKLYGYIERTIPAGSVLTFSVMANFAVERSKASKALVVSENYIFGGKNHWLGTSFIAVGSIAAIIGVFFLCKDTFAPRRLGDRMYLKYKED